MDKKDEVFARCAWRLIPLMALLFIVNYVDRVNVGFAALTMNRDLGFSPSVYGFGAGIFQLGYALFLVPAAVMVERVGAKRAVFWMLAVWGVISAGNAFVQDAWSFYAVRFLLGVAEAGFFPGMIYYLTLWFPRSHRARCLAAFWSGVPMAIVIGGPVSVLILEMDGLGGLHGWQWLFLIEGLPAVLLAFAVLRLLPNGPSQAPWLSPADKNVIAARLAEDRIEERHDLWRALRDFRVLGLGVVYLGWSFGFYGLVLWLPQIVQATGFSNLATGFIVAVPYMIGVGSAILWARSSDAKDERVWHCALAILLATTGFAVASLASFSPLVLVGLSVAAIGMSAAISPLFSLPSSFFSGPAAAGAIGLVGAIGRIGALLGPIVIGVMREQTGGYAASMFVLALALLLAVVILLALGRAMAPRAAMVRAKVGG